jgi:hypothetical protein
MKVCSIFRVDPATDVDTGNVVREKNGEPIDRRQLACVERGEYAKSRPRCQFPMRILIAFFMMHGRMVDDSGFETRFSVERLAPARRQEKRGGSMIDAYEAGRWIRIDGRTYHSDLKIIGDEVRAGWWRKAGHRLYPSDISDILEGRPDVLVVGTGYAGMMQVPDATREALESRGIRLQAEKTDSAVRVFNRLRKAGRRVAGAFHLTC